MPEDKKVNVGTIGSVDNLGRGFKHPNVSVWDYPVTNIPEPIMKPKGSAAAKAARSHHRPHGHRFARGR